MFGLGVREYAWVMLGLAVQAKSPPVCSSTLFVDLVCQFDSAIRTAGLKWHNLPANWYPGRVVFGGAIELYASSSSSGLELMKERPLASNVSTCISNEELTFSSMLSARARHPDVHPLACTLKEIARGAVSPLAG